MRTYEELCEGCAQMLQDIRMEEGLSKAKMANMLCIDDHTWARYESGKSAPTVPEFLHLFSILDRDALRTVLRFVYPDVYTKMEQESSPAKMREELWHYIMSVASDHGIEEGVYFVTGNHGSSLLPQMEMFTMYNHLPLEYRFIVADLIDSLWSIADARGEIVSNGVAMPHVETFRDGLKAAKRSVEKGLDGYSTTIKKV